MRTILTLSIYFYFLSFCQAQDTHSISFNFNKKIELKTSINSDITYCVDSSIFYYHKNSLKKNSKNDVDSVLLLIRTVNINTKKQDSFYLCFPKSDAIFNWSLKSLDINSEYIVVKGDRIYIFNRSTKQLYDIIDSKKCGNLKLLSNDQLLMYNNYNSHPLDDTVKTKFYVYNIKNKTYSAPFKPNFNYILYTHLVGNYIDISVNKSKILFGQSIPYNISIYSTEKFKKVNNFFGEINNTNQHIDSLKNLHHKAEKDRNVKSHIYQLKSVDRYLNRIEKVLFLADDTILISKKTPNSGFKKRMIDIWTYNNSSEKWTRIIKDQTHINEFATSSTAYKITTKNIPLNLTYSNKLIVNNGKIYLVSTVTPPDIGISSNQIKQNLDQYYESHELNYFIWEFEYTIK